MTVFNINLRTQLSQRTVFFPTAYATAARGDFCWQYLSIQAAWCTSSGVILHNHFCKPSVYSKFISDQQLDSKIELQQVRSRSQQSLNKFHVSLLRFMHIISQSRRATASFLFIPTNGSTGNIEN